MLKFKSKRFVTLVCVTVGSATHLAQASDENNIVGEEKAELTYAPNVPKPITRKNATKVIVQLEVKEEVQRLADGVSYNFWTFGGKVPGQFIRIREGDLVEFHLNNNPMNKMPHNIDLHSVSGPGGGAASSMTAPGHSSVFSFKALNPGLYVYHCATAPVGMHIANGMYGLILVEPKEGLPKVDREYYVMQSEFYTAGANGEKGLQPFSMQKTIEERPDYVVFNGSVGASIGNNALKANVGETVRLFVGNGGPNLTSSFHVIGAVFDKVYLEGGTTITNNVQTTSIPAGGSAITEFKVTVPGTYVIVDHSITRTFNKGALAQLKVTGPENKEIYSGKISDEVFLPEGPNYAATDAKKPTAPTAKNKAERLVAGKSLYEANCAACHQNNGSGIPSAFPPLANSDYLKNKDKGQIIKLVRAGLTGMITVNGKDFDGVMPAMTLNDEDLANTLTYIYNNWGNPGIEVTPEDVKKIK